MQFPEATKIYDLRVSQRWLGKVLKQYDWNYLNIHGGDYEMSNG